MRSPLSRGLNALTRLGSPPNSLPVRGDTEQPAAAPAKRQSSPEPSDPALAHLAEKGPVCRTHPPRKPARLPPGRYRGRQGGQGSARVTPPWVGRRAFVPDKATLIDPPPAPIGLAGRAPTRPSPGSFACSAPAAAPRGETPAFCHWRGGRSVRYLRPDTGSAAGKGGGDTPDACNLPSQPRLPAASPIATAPLPGEANGQRPVRRRRGGAERSCPLLRCSQVRKRGAAFPSALPLLCCRGRCSAGRGGRCCAEPSQARGGGVLSADFSTSWVGKARPGPEH